MTNDTLRCMDKRANAQCHVIEQMYSLIQLIYCMNNAPLFTLPHLQMQYFTPECRFNENDNHANTQNYKFNTNNSIIQHFQKQMKSTTYPL